MVQSKLMNENIDDNHPVGESKFSPVSINRIHFLIHPGFITDPRIMLEVSTPEEIDANKSILGKYLEYTKKMRNDELMFVFLHTSPQELRKDFIEGKDYTKTLNEMKEMLGKRLIALSNKLDIFDKPDAIKTALDIAKRRGFNIDPSSVETIAYGETSLVCVPNGAENLNEAGGFVKKTTIIPELTTTEDSAEEIQSIMKGIELELKKSHKRLVVQEVTIPEKNKLTLLSKD